MGNVYREQLIKRQPRLKDNLIKIAIVAGDILLVFLSIQFLPEIAPLVLVAATVGAYFLFGFLSVEYEYIFIGGELNIDVIYNKRRRKPVYKGELKDCEIMCHVSNMDYTSVFATVKQVIDCSESVSANNKYMFLTSYNGKKVKIIFEPNGELIKDMMTFLGQRKFIIKK